MNKIQSKGFSVVIVLVALLIIAILVFAGWYVWQKNSQTNSNPNEMPSVGSAKDDKYLVIKEWDLRITLPEALRGDISYFVNDGAERDFGGPLLIDFTSKKFSSGKLKCSEVESLPRSLVSIYKEEPGVETKVPSPFKQIGDTRYYFSEASCAGAIEREGPAEDQQLLANLKEAIATTLESYDQ